MGRRIPINLTPEQSMVLLLVVAAVVVVLVALAVLELVLGRGAAFALRLGRRPPPRKSPTRVALDELEKRLRHRGEQ
jgi:hypothetical protein